MGRVTAPEPISLEISAQATRLEYPWLCHYRLDVLEHAS